MPQFSLKDKVTRVLEKLRQIPGLSIRVNPKNSLQVDIMYPRFRQNDVFSVQLQDNRCYFGVRG
jgi:hypothetical protein